LDKFPEDRLLLPCVLGVALGGEGDRARPMMKRASERHVVRIIFRLGENVIPLSEAHHHFHRYRTEGLYQGCVFSHELCRQIFYHFAHVTHRKFALARHERGVREHVLVVRGVHGE
jgi:hypothetical protein